MSLNTDVNEDIIYESTPFNTVSMVRVNK